MGCGKSTIGKLLAQKLDYNFIDCDTYLEQKYEKTIDECFKISESYFRELESNCLEELTKGKSQIISTGGGVVTVEKNLEYLKDDLVIFINRPLELILSDVDTATRPLLKDGKEKLIGIYDERINLYKKFCDFEIINDVDLDTIVDLILKKL